MMYAMHADNGYLPLKHRVYTMSQSGRTQRQPPKPSPLLEDFERWCRVVKEKPFLDEKPMSDTAAACAWQDFKRPLLGRFTRHERVDFIELLGYGEDGIVWKVNIGSQACALKVVRNFVEYITCH